MEPQTRLTAPSDYTAKSLTGQTIPSGSSTYTFDVLVNGDLLVEPDETFFVNVTNVTGANVTDGQGLGTILNDDVVAVPTNPSGTGNANPNNVTSGSSTLLTVSVTPGTTPASTGLTVKGDLSTIGGSATQTFFDNGTNGDVTAGDNIFSYNAVVAPGTSVGSKTLPITIQDAQLRTGSTNISLTVSLPGAALNFDGVNDYVAIPITVHELSVPVSLQKFGSSPPLILQVIPGPEHC